MRVAARRRTSRSRRRRPAPAHLAEGDAVEPLEPHPAAGQQRHRARHHPVGRRGPRVRPHRPGADEPQELAGARQVARPTADPTPPLGAGPLGLRARAPPSLRAFRRNGGYSPTQPEADGLAKIRTRARSPRILRAGVAVLATLALATVGVVLPLESARANTMTVGCGATRNADLVEAIETANRLVGGVLTVTLTAGCTYALTTIYRDPYGASEGRTPSPSSSPASPGPPSSSRARARRSPGRRGTIPLLRHPLHGHGDPQEPPPHRRRFAARQRYGAVGQPG